MYSMSVFFARNFDFIACREAYINHFYMILTKLKNEKDAKYAWVHVI